MITKLETIFSENGIKYTPWAKQHDISPAVIYRYLKGKDISLQNARKITNALKGKITLKELLFPETAQ